MNGVGRNAFERRALYLGSIASSPLPRHRVASATSAVRVGDLRSAGARAQCSSARGARDTPADRQTRNVRPKKAAHQRACGAQPAHQGLCRCAGCVQGGAANVRAHAQFARPHAAQTMPISRIKPSVRRVTPRSLNTHTTQRLDGRRDGGGVPAADRRHQDAPAARQGRQVPR